MIIFIVTGRLGENLVYYKTMPVAAIESVKHVYVFTVHRCRPVEKVTFINPPSWIGYIWPLAKIIERIYEPLQILFYALKHNPYIINGVYTIPKGLYSIIISKITGSHGMVSVLGGKEEMDTELFPKKFWRSVNWWLVRQATAITTKGMHDNQYFMSKGIKPEKIFTFNGCIDLARFYDNGTERDIDIVFVGSFYELKGPDRIVDVISKIKRSLPHLKAYMIGSGIDYQKTVNQAVSSGLEDTISFPGFVKDTESYYKRAKTLILMSRSEGNPNCMLEAMACGCVPVVPNVGNISETIHHNMNGLLINDCYDIDGFEVALTQLLTNESFRQELASRGKATIKNKYSIANQANDFERIINFTKSAN